MADPTKIIVKIRDGNNTPRDMFFEDARSGTTTGIIPLHRLTGSVEITNTAGESLEVSSTETDPVYITASTNHPVSVEVLNSDINQLYVTSSQTNPVYVTSSVTNPFYVRITSSINDKIYVTSSNTNPVYITSSYQNPVPVKVSSSANEPAWVTSSHANPVYVTSSATSPFYVTSSTTSPIYVSSTPQRATTTQVILYTDESTYADNGLTILKPLEAGTTTKYYKFKIDADVHRKSLIISNINSYATVADDFYVFVGGEVDNNGADPVRYSFPLPSANVYIAEPGTAHLEHGLFVLKDSTGYMALQVTKIT